jgi:hypothetical protein
MEQRSPEWWAAKVGKVGASRIGDLTRKTQKGAWSADRTKYLRDKVAERVTGKPREGKRVASLDHRVDLEPDARAAYSFYFDLEPVLVGFIDHPRIPNAGASPDSLVGDDGGLEIKCPDVPAHLDLITAGDIDRDYILQCQFGMACTDRKWWDFISFNPDMPEMGRIFRKRIERDDALIAMIEQAVIEFNAEVDRRVEEVLAAMRGTTALEVQLAGSLASLNVH